VAPARMRRVLRVPPVLGFPVARNSTQHGTASLYGLDRQHWSLA
jgi:hypothetical protein